MKIGITIGALGIIVSVIGWYGDLDGMSGGILTLFIGYPLILVGLIVVIYRVVTRKR
ncbi:MAG: hypothetical protein UY17_C0023G0003 [Candidatus Beckwithbacteria bacterium GW2011_GWC2_47_9]|uniref:Uncharacterized protein n=1 Tax=Candidatus Beckwithbacteria bacterium GW2011_GWC2_47_9 TaxID=1618373 RepID=A0A0G1TZK9_9BACT|nr:MAG: hypothetical protein UX94_C0013G0021 [Parcubacteria group bacterium GW2011_GWA2_47_21]KKU87261.1 MAG: hypothetical protein UY17_C0023G0003 [Candidatus Beckwithbacteria bacterium GW2011_GWC2_47_9]